MRLEPTQRATHLSWAGLGLLALGLALVNTALVSYGSALLFGVAVSRALAQLSVARARASGFEMLWSSAHRALRAQRNRPSELSLELRNRDRHPIRFRDLTVTHAPALRVDVHPSAGEIPPHGRLCVRLRVVPRRVGYHGIHGLTLTAVHAPGLFTVPLAFSSPVVLEVLPRSIHLNIRSARGGAQTGRADDGIHGRSRGDGSQFQELREHQPGDPFKRIAWKASARRGRLLVTENEQPERDSVWFLVDASVESAAGAPGEAPLDTAIDQVARLAEGHLGRGDRVGLSLLARRELVRIPLGRGPRQLGKVLTALSFQTHTADADRSDWDEGDVRRRVLDHLRSLDSRAHALSTSDQAPLLALAQATLARAPLRAQAPWAESAENAFFLQYLLSFGIQPPPRGASERALAERELGRALRALSVVRPRPSMIYVFARAPAFDTPREFTSALRAVVKNRVTLVFHALAQLPPGDSDRELDEKTRMVRDALGARLELGNERAARELGRLGVRFRPPPAPRGT